MVQLESTLAAKNMAAIRIIIFIGERKAHPPLVATPEG
jgi:hypothetical protein